MVPETFKRAAEARHPDKPVAAVPVLPAESIDGRFAPAEGLPGGWYLHGAVDSGITLPNTAMADLAAPRMPMVSRNSFDSNVSGASGTNSVYMPKQVESIMNEEDRRKYFFAQQAQRAPTGAYMNVENLDHGRVYEMTDEMDRKGIWSDDVDELSSEEEALKSSRSHPRYQQSYVPSRGFSPAISPDFAPSRPSRLSNYHNVDDLDDEDQDFSLPAARHPTPSPVYDSRIGRDSDHKTNVPLIRLPTGEQRGPIAPQQETRPQEVRRDEVTATGSGAQTGSEIPLMTEEADTLGHGSTIPQAKTPRKVYKPWVRT